MQKKSLNLLLILLFSNSFITGQEEQVPTLFELTLESIKNNFDRISFEELCQNPLFDDFLPKLIYHCFKKQIIPPIRMKDKKEHEMCFYPNTISHGPIIYDHNKCCSLIFNYSPQQYDIVATSITIENPHIVDKCSLGTEENSPMILSHQVLNSLKKNSNKLIRMSPWQKVICPNAPTIS